MRKTRLKTVKYVSDILIIKALLSFVSHQFLGNNNASKVSFENSIDQSFYLVRALKKSFFLIFYSFPKCK